MKAVRLVQVALAAVSDFAAVGGKEGPAPLAGLIDIDVVVHVGGLS